MATGRLSRLATMDADEAFSAFALRSVQFLRRNPVLEVLVFLAGVAGAVWSVRFLGWSGLLLGLLISAGFFAVIKVVSWISQGLIRAWKRRPG